MPKSWSLTRRQLEQEFLCESLRGRVQYFLTHYHNIWHEDDGRFAVRVDGEEVFHAHPYNEWRYDVRSCEIKRERCIPEREWTNKGVYLHEDENRQAEEEGRILAIYDGYVDSFDIPRAIKKYMNQDIAASLRSDDPLIRLFAILDRRVGKRTLKRLVQEVDQQPEWLKRFYYLRFESEGIAVANRKET